VIYGIGIDIIEIARMRAAVEKWGERFLRKVFTGNEIAHCYEKKNPFPSLSVRFAAKEALIKAIGSRVSPFTDMEILNDDRGKPFIKASGKLGVFLKERSLRAPHLSLSHEQDYGIAFVVLEKDGE
jgi:holo-[acyl-carrier protein] synthase